MDSQICDHERPRTPTAQLPHTSRTARAGTVHPRCARVPCWPARTRKGRCSKAFLTSPPHPETSGEARSGTAAKRVRSVQQGKGQGQGQGQTRNPYRRPAASICHAPRGTRRHREVHCRRGTAASNGRNPRLTRVGSQPNLEGRGRGSATGRCARSSCRPGRVESVLSRIAASGTTRP
jgi:hypothetical protein